MDGARDVVIFITVVIALGIMWVQSGGPERESARKPFITSPFSSLNIPTASVRTSSEDERLEDDPTDTSRYTSLGERSRYAAAVVFNTGTSGAKNTTVQNEYVEIYANRRNTAPINITGWKLHSPITQRSAVIHGAVVTPHSGVTNTEQPIFLGPGETAIISTGRSPIGSSFRTNICTGYFGQFQNFTPRLAERCPYPEDELNLTIDTIRTFGDECLDFIERLPRCEMYIEPIPVQYPAVCNAFIVEELNYTGCVRAHQEDEDFHQNEWRLYLGRDNELWKSKREIVTLIDTEGKIVDTLSY